MQNFYYYFYYSFVQFYRSQGRFFADDPYVWAVIGISMVPSALIWSILLAAKSAGWGMSSYQSLVDYLPGFLQFGWIYLVALGLNWAVFLRTKKCNVIDERYSGLAVRERRKGHVLSALVVFLIIAFWFYQIFSFEKL
jgi:hypothetical protein